jgi:hypothetical protein
MMITSPIRSATGSARLDSRGPAAPLTCNWRVWDRSGNSATRPGIRARGHGIVPLVCWVPGLERQTEMPADDPQEAPTR